MRADPTYKIHAGKIAPWCRLHYAANSDIRTRVPNVFYYTRQSTERTPHTHLRCGARFMRMLFHRTPTTTGTPGTPQHRRTHTRFAAHMLALRRWLARSLFLLVSRRTFHAKTTLTHA